MGRTLKKSQQVERSIITKYRKLIWNKFMKGIIDYKLIDENDNIMVCMSGGKDSFLLAKCIQELQRHGKFPFKARFVVMNPGYSERNVNLIKENAEKLDIPIEMFESDIFEVVDTTTFRNPCYLCARMRRGFLYNKAKELGCNKIALGHHFDDAIETTLLSMFYGAELKTMLPKLHSTNFEEVDLIRPLYLVKEQSIISWKNYNDLTFLNCACRFTERNANTDDLTSKRKVMKELIKNLRKEYKEIDYNIYKSMDNVNLECVLGTKYHGEYHSFMEDFDKEKQIQKEEHEKKKNDIYDDIF